MKIHFAVLAFACGALSSQQVVMGVSGSSPYVATTLVLGSPDTQTGGPAPGVVQSSQTIGAESAAATNTTTALQAAIGCSASFQHDLAVTAAPLSTVEATATSDVVLQFTSATPESVVLQVSGTLLATAGAAAPALSIDLGADGSFEWTSGPATPSFSLPMTITSAVTAVRMRMESRLDLSGSMRATMSVGISPVHATQIDIVLFGCSVPYHLYAFRTFGGGVEFGTFGLPPTAPVLLVFGLGVFPFVLPSAAPSPCIVLPTIDIVTVIPSPSGLALPLPPSVRPVTFWAQAIPLVPAGFEATGAYRVQAN